MLYILYYIVRYVFYCMFCIDTGQFAHIHFVLYHTFRTLLYNMYIYILYIYILYMYISYMYGLYINLYYDFTRIFRQYTLVRVHYVYYYTFCTCLICRYMYIMYIIV